jgi:NAD(P)-dependent dehydrogenase (short-subunit alcohol dehydrogenase family)
MADPSDLFTLDGKVALVTGAAGLYGRPISEALAVAGATVVLAARGLDAITAFAAELEARGHPAAVRRLDLADDDSIERVCDDVLGRLGRIDILVNNAVHRAGGDFFATTGDDFEATHRVNGRGLFLLTRRCAAAMAEAGSGSIIHISSIYGATGPDFSIYDGTGMTNAPTYAYDKGGMIAFSRYLATLLGPCGVRSNCLVPGGLETEQDERFIAAYQSRTPLRRMAEVDDIKGPVVFLASEASRYVTGVTIPVDGGWTAQ